MKILVIVVFSSFALSPLSWAQNNFLSTLFSNILSLRFSLTMTAQVSKPYTTTCEVILVALYILGYQTERRKLMDQIVTDIFRIHSAFNLFYACYFYFSAI